MTTATSMLSEVLRFRESKVLCVERTGDSGLFLVVVGRYEYDRRLEQFTCCKDIAAIYYRKYLEQQEESKRMQHERNREAQPMVRRFSLLDYVLAAVLCADVCVIVFAIIKLFDILMSM